MGSYFLDSSDFAVHLTGDFFTLRNFIRYSLFFFPRQLPLRKSIKVSEPMTVFGYTPQGFKVIYCIWFTLTRPYKDVARTNYWSHDVNLFHLKRITRRALNFLMHSPECICMLWFQLFHSSWRGRSKQRHVPSILFVNSHNLTSRWTQERD